MARGWSGYQRGSGIITISAIGSYCLPAVTDIIDLPSRFYLIVWWGNAAGMCMGWVLWPSLPQFTPLQNGIIVRIGKGKAEDEERLVRLLAYSKLFLNGSFRGYSYLGLLEQNILLCVALNCL